MEHKKKRKTTEKPVVFFYAPKGPTWEELKETKGRGRKEP